MEDTLAGRQRADHELRRVFAPQHDVDALAGQFVGDGVDARATNTHAGADRVDTLVVREHGDLGARTGVAGAALDLQQALLDLGHFLAEQLDHELGGGARQDDGRAAQRQVHFHDHGADAVAVAQVFLGDHLAAAQAPFDAARFDDDVALVHALDGAHEDLVAARHEVVEQHLALGVADLLQDHLLGSHGADAADRHRIHRFLDVVVHVDVGDLLLGFEQQDFLFGQLQAGLVRHHVPAAEGFVVAAVAVDRDADVHVAFVQLLGGLRQGRLHRAENHVTLDVLLARDRFDQHQQFAIHFTTLLLPWASCP